MATSRSEVEIVSDFISNNENTMNIVATCSVGTALLHLRNIYLGEQPEEAEVKEFNQRCIKELKELAASPEHAAFKLAINYILRRAAEPNNQLDVVTLYRSSQDNESAILKAEEYVFPLAEVLSLVWAAITDNNGYLWHYQGGREQRLECAQADFADRLKGFLSCLESLRLKSVCHQGNRNELAFLLMKAYEDIHLLEDGKLTVIKYLKEKLFEQVWMKITQVGENTPERKVLCEALIHWMSEGNAERLFKEAEGENGGAIRSGLRKLFLGHGVSPDVISLDKLIKQALKCLNFACDSQVYPALAHANEILKEMADPRQEVRSEALALVQIWLKEVYQYNDTNNLKITHFHQAYFTHKKLHKYGELLMMTDQATVNEYEMFARHLDAYFAEQLTSKEPMLLSDDALIEISLIKDKLNWAEADNLISTIENFFARWFVAEKGGNFDEIRRLYSLLVSDDFAKKINLTESEIARIQSASDVGAELVVTPYTLNRLFLHAILNKPEDWSEQFAALFNETRKFIEKGFERNDSVLMANQLKRDSYPKPLLNQLNYLSKENIRKKSDEVSKDLTPRPERMILLPSQAISINEWKGVLHRLREDKVEGVLRVYWARIQNIINNGKDLKEILPLLPSGSRLNFLVRICRQKRNIILRGKALGKTLCFLLSADQVAFITAFASNLKQFFSNGKKFASCLVYLSQPNQLAFIAALGENVKEIFHKMDELIYCFQVLTNSVNAALLDALGDKVKDIIRKKEQLSACLQVLSSSQQVAFLAALQYRIKEFFYDPQEFGCVSQIMNSVCEREILSYDKFIRRLKASLSGDNLVSCYQLFLHGDYFSYFTRQVFSRLNQEIGRLKSEGDRGVGKAKLLMFGHLALQEKIKHVINKYCEDTKTYRVSFSVHALENIIHTALVEEVQQLAESAPIRHYRNPVAAFFRKLLGFLLAAPFLFFPLISERYRSFFFDTASSRAFKGVVEDLVIQSSKAPNLQRG